MNKVVEKNNNENRIEEKKIIIKDHLFKINKDLIQC